MIVTTRGWTGAAITYAHTSGSETYTLSAPDRRNAYEVAEDLRAWLMSGLRPWAGDVDTVSLVVGSDGKRHRFSFTVTGPAPSFLSVTPNATWIARFGDTSQSPTGVCRASCAATPDTLGWDRIDVEVGEVSRDGAWRMTHAGLAHRRPSVSVGYTLAQAFARDEMLRAATEPREAYIYRTDTGEWMKVALGKHETTHPMADPKIQQTTFEVLG